MLCLTRQERGVLVFLLAVCLAGTGLDFLSKQKTLPLPAAGIASRLGKVDLNKADKETLVAIPGIGEKTACRMIDYRRAVGRFQSLDEVKNVKGMNASRLERLKEYVFVEAK